MRKTLTTKLITLLMALVLMVTAIPIGSITAEAATNPGAVTKIIKSEINPTTITIQYNKAKNAKGYQIRTYKGGRLVKNAKTKNTSYTIKGLSAETKYIIKVRAYNGNKYGKEKSITVKTETKNLAVTSLKASKVKSNSVKITYKKALNAKGYQIRVYKGSKQVANVKTKNTSYTISKLSGNTKYTVKVRAYKGSKYGKEKSVTFKTAKKAAGDDDSLDITDIKVTEVGSNSVNLKKCYVKLEYNKTKVSAIYEVRIYKGNELVYNTEEFDNTFYYGGLSGETEYTIKVKAYPNPYFNPKKYGKEASVTVKTPKAILTAYPGESTSEGDQLVEEYNEYVAYIANDWSDYEAVKKAMNDPQWKDPVTCLDSNWFSYTSMMFHTWDYSDAYTDKYQAFKHNCGTLDAITEYYADVLAACGLTVTIIDINPQEDYDRYGQTYALNYNKDYWEHYYDSMNFEVDTRIHKAVTVITQDGKTHTVAVIPIPCTWNSSNSLIRTTIGYSHFTDPTTHEYSYTENWVDGRTILWTCPDCGIEYHDWENIKDRRTANGYIPAYPLQTASKISSSCKNSACKSYKIFFDITNPYYGTDLSEPVYRRTGTVISKSEH